MTLVFAAAFLGLMGFLIANGAWYFVMVGVMAFFFFTLVHWLVR